METEETTCKHVPFHFTGREVSDRYGKKFPTCEKCGLSKKMYDYLRHLRSDKT